MNIEEIREYCLEMKGVTETFPFDDVTLVFKVVNKMFALVSIDSDPLRINLKCDPEKAMLLREEFESVIPGYHMNKKHWNSIIINGSIPSNLIKEWIDDSYSLVVKSLPKKVQKELLN